MLHLDALAPRTPRLPRHQWDWLTPIAASTALHLFVAVVAAVFATAFSPGAGTRQTGPSINPDVTPLVFLAPELRGTASGGGGGGNRRPDPVRRAQAIGTDTITQRVGSQAPSAPVTARSPLIDDVPAIPSIVLEAAPLASGMFDQAGLPAGGVLSGTSLGPGSGGGGGTGSGTGIGSGRGAGLGPGSGGGTGGGVYRAGGAVSTPRLIKEVRPRYTSHALLNRIQGTVVLEAVVTRDGCASHIRVVRSLDPGGLDEEAVATVAQWQFEPGRLAGTPVDVLVMILLDFTIR